MSTPRTSTCMLLHPLSCLAGAAQPTVASTAADEAAAAERAAVAMPIESSRLEQSSRCRRSSLCSRSHSSRCDRRCSCSRSRSLSRSRSRSRSPADGDEARVQPCPRSPAAELALPPQAVGAGNTGSSGSMGLLAASGEQPVPTPTALPADPASPDGRRARAELRESL